MRSIVSDVRDWFRIVLPSYLTSAFAAYVILWSTMLALRIASDHFLIHGTLIVLGSLVLPLCLAYALFRYWYFHPLENNAYGNWLWSTPWHYPQRLPLGPLLPTWQDIVIVGTFTAIHLVTACFGEDAEFSDVQHYAWNPLLVFLYVQGVFAWLSAVLRGQRFGTDLLSLLMGFAVANAMYFPAVVVMAFLIGITGAVSTHLSLKLFTELPPEFTRLNITESLRQLMALYWPSEQLLMSRPGPILEWHQAFSWSLNIAVLWGGLAHLFLHEEGAEIAEYYVQFILFPIGIGLSLRLMIYCLRYLPPYAVIGRITVGRIFVPAYDKVLVAPLLCIALLILTGTILPYLNWPPAISVGVPTFFGCWLLLGMGPSLDSWRHTGHHRMLAGSPPKPSFWQKEQIAKVNK